MAVDREKIVTAAIIAGLFGGLVGGPVASLADYYAPPERRFWLFMIPEFIGFCCMGLLVYYSGRSRKKEKEKKGSLLLDV
ncbi:MAG: hypothetical protein AB1753_06345 [Thermoproteota archaeon]